MMDIYSRDPLWLEISIAAHMDLEILVSTTYEMEGDRLEILLLFSRFEAIRQLGRSLRDDETNRGGGVRALADVCGGGSARSIFRRSARRRHRFLRARVAHFQRTG